MRLPFLQIAGSLLGFVLIGTPLVACVWDALNRLMAGHVEPPRLALAVVAGLLLAALLRFLVRVFVRWEQQP
jgi:hypothetical protein